MGDNELKQKVKSIRELNNNCKKIKQEEEKLKLELIKDLQTIIKSKNGKWTSSWGDPIEIRIDYGDYDCLFYFYVHDMDSKLINILIQLDFVIDMWVDGEDIVVGLK